MSTFLKLLAGGFLALVVLLAFLSASEPRRPESSPEEEAEFQHLVLGALTIKHSMRNPDSFVLERVLVPAGSSTACYEYRAQYGFGGMNRGQAVWAGEDFKTSEMGELAALWNKHCADKPGKDRADLIKYAVR